MDFISFIKKLRFFDYLIIIVLALGLVITYQFFNPEEKWVDVLISDSKVPLYQSSSIKEGNFEVSPTGDKSAVVNNISVYDSNNTTNTLILNVKLKTNVNRRSKELEYKNKIIKVGAPIELKLNSGVFKGEVISFGGSILPATTKTLTLKLYKQWPWFADSINIGEGEDNSQGDKIVEVISKEIKPAEVVVDTAGGNRVLAIDPQWVDITLKVKVGVGIIDNEFIYKQYRKLYIGDNFSFNTGKSQVSQTLISNIE